MGDRSSVESDHRFASRSAGGVAPAVLLTRRDWHRDLQDSAVLSRGSRLFVSSGARPDIAFEFSSGNPPWRLVVEENAAEKAEDPLSVHNYYPETDYLTLRKRQNRASAERKLQEGRDASDRATAQACFQQGLDLWCPAAADDDNCSTDALRQALEQAHREASLMVDDPKQQQQIQPAASMPQEVKQQQQQRMIGGRGSNAVVAKKSAKVLQDAVLERAMMGHAHLPVAAAADGDDVLYPMLSSSSSDEEDQRRARRRNRRKEKKRKHRSNKKKHKRRRRRDSSINNDDDNDSSASRSSNDSNRRRRRRKKRKRRRNEEGDRSLDNDSDDRDSTINDPVDHVPRNRQEQRKSPLSSSSAAEVKGDVRRRKRQKRRDRGDCLDSDDATVDSLKAANDNRDAPYKRQRRRAREKKQQQQTVKSSKEGTEE